MSLRLRYLTPTVIRHAPLAPPALDFVGIDLEAQRRWTDSLPALSALLPASLKLSKPNDLRVLLDDPHACQALQERLLKDKSSLRTTLALLIAGEVNFSDRDMSWLPDWVVGTSPSIVEAIVSISARPTGPPASWIVYLLQRASRLQGYCGDTRSVSWRSLRSFGGFGDAEEPIKRSQPAAAPQEICVHPQETGRLSGRLRRQASSHN